MLTVTEVPATVHVPATSDATELGAPASSAQTQVAPHHTDVYSTLKLDVTVDSIKLELFTGDSNLVRRSVDKLLSLLLLLSENLYCALSSKSL